MPRYPELVEIIRRQSAWYVGYLNTWAQYYAAHSSGYLPYPELREHLSSTEYTVGGLFENCQYVMRFIRLGSRWVYASTIYQGERVFLG